MLLELDYPQGKEVPADVMAKREELSQKYAIEAFPTLYFADAQGRPFAEAPLEMDVETWPAVLEGAAKAGDEFQATLKSADTLEGVAKAEALVTVLDAVPGGLGARFYPDLGEQIIAADPDDSTGFRARVAAEERKEKFNEALSAAANEGDWAAAIKVVDAELAQDGLTATDKQELIGLKAQIQYETGDVAAVIKTLEEAIAVDPESEMGTQLTAVVAELKKELEAAPAEEAEAAE